MSKHTKRQINVDEFLLSNLRFVLLVNAVFLSYFDASMAKEEEMKF